MRPYWTRGLALWTLCVGVILLVRVPAGTAEDDPGAEIKRRLDQWKNGPHGDLLFQGVQVDAPAATAGPKAVALCVGVDYANKDHYGEKAPRLLGCVQDAVAVGNLARTAGFDVTLMTDERATTEAFTKFLDQQAQTLKAGDFLWVYFAGYGGQMDVSGQPTHDILAFYNRMLVDDELFESWTHFGTPGVRIVLVTDSGNKGTLHLTFPLIQKVIAGPPSAIGTALDKVPGQRAAMATYTANDVHNKQGQPVEWPAVRIRRLVKGEPEEFYQSSVYRDVDNRKLAGRKAAEGAMKVRVLHLAASPADGPAIEINARGVYTSALEDAWKSGDAVKTYDQLQKLVAEKTQGQSPPTKIGYGPKDEAFDAQRPFAR